MADRKASAWDQVTALVTDDRVLALQTSPEMKLVSIPVQNLRRDAYGQLSVTGASTSQDIGINTFTKVTAWTTAVSGASVVADHTADTISLPDAGEYVATVNLVLDVSAGDTFRFQVYWNGTAQGVYHEAIRSGTGRFSVSFQTRIAALATGQAVELRALAVGGADITIAEGTLDVERIA